MNDAVNHYIKGSVERALTEDRASDAGLQVVPKLFTQHVNAVKEPNSLSVILYHASRVQVQDGCVWAMPMPSHQLRLSSE